KCIPQITLLALVLAFTSTSRADESAPPAANATVLGKWTAQFDSQIGQQRYTFEFKLDAGKLAGKAIGEREMGTNEVTLVDVKLDKDEISFVEPLKLADNEVRIEYKGKVAGEQIKLHRKVGDIA